jgi:hypothetical protein
MVKKLAFLFIFGVAFGFLEAVVVYYLRQLIGYQAGYSVGQVKVLLNLGVIAFIEPSTSLLKNQTLGAVEGFRELATILMLLSISWVSAEKFRQRLGAFLITFSLWDLFYYLFLHVLTGWPGSFLDIDVFFLIPVPWVGPVITPVIIFIILFSLGVWLFIKPKSTHP